MLATAKGVREEYGPIPAASYFPSLYSPLWVKPWNSIDSNVTLNHNIQGFGAPVPRTPQGRGAAILFAAVGIPLHFLLILNMGNLMAIKLQKLAFKGNPSDLPQPNAPLWLKWFPVVVITLYYFLGVIFFGFVRQRDAIDSFMFPLDFTAVGGVASVAGHVRVLYALYLEVAVTLAAIIVSLIQASTTRGIVDLCLRLGLLTNTWTPSPSWRIVKVNCFTGCTQDVFLEVIQLWFMQS